MQVKIDITSTTKITTTTTNNNNNNEAKTPLGF